MHRVPFFITVDVEAHRSLVEFWGNIGKNRLGLDKILQLLHKYNFKAVFFVDFCEIKKWGKSEIMKVVNRLRNSGQDIELHIHPHHYGDSKRWLLWEYSKEEQKNIIEYCVNQYKKIVGSYPLAFRAGGYGANLETLDILNEMGIKYDFSLFYKNKKCKLYNRSIKTINKITKYKEIYEIPVTVFNDVNLLGKEIRYDKLDFNSATSWEIERILKYMRNFQPTHIILFLHSSSFLVRDKKNNFKPNWRIVNKLDRILFFLKNQKDYDVLNIRDFDRMAESYLDEFIKESKDVIYCERNPFRQYLGTLYRTYVISKLNNKGRIFIIINILIWITLIISIIIMLK